MSQDLIKALRTARIMHNADQQELVCLPPADFKVIRDHIDAISRHRSSVESVELPGDEAVASIYINVHGDREFDDWNVELSAGAHDLFTASTVRSLIAAAVEREREECAKVCKSIEDEYQRAEGRRYPELKSDAQTGAGVCAAAIRARGEK